MQVTDMYTGVLVTTSMKACKVDFLMKLLRETRQREIKMTFLATVNIM